MWWHNFNLIQPDGDHIARNLHSVILEQGPLKEKLEHLHDSVMVTIPINALTNTNTFLRTSLLPNAHIHTFHVHNYAIKNIQDRQPQSPANLKPPV